MTPKAIPGISNSSVKIFTNQWRSGQTENIQMQIALPINPKTARPKPKYPPPLYGEGQKNSSKKLMPKSEITDTDGYNQTSTESFGSGSRKCRRTSSNYRTGLRCSRCILGIATYTRSRPRLTTPAFNPAHSETILTQAPPITRPFARF